MSYLLLITEPGPGQTSIIEKKTLKEVRSAMQQSLNAGFTLDDMRLFTGVIELDTNKAYVEKGKKP